MDAFSNVGNALPGIHPANKVVGVKPIHTRDDRRRREARHGQDRAMGPGDEGYDGCAVEPAQGEAGKREKPPGLRKVDVVV